MTDDERAAAEARLTALPWSGPSGGYVGDLDGDGRVCLGGWFSPAELRALADAIAPPARTGRCAAMTADELALIAAVNAAPEDDLPRLVYANWLREHGRDDRAEFIAVQCELARLRAAVGVGAWLCESPERKDGNSWLSACGRCHPCRLFHRELGFLRGPCPSCDWHAPMPHGGWEWQFARGFVEEITCSAEGWLRYAHLIHWRPGQRCDRCGGSGRFTHSFDPPCRDCNGTGTRPCPPSAQPVTRVRLTTTPTLEEIVAGDFYREKDEWGEPALSRRFPGVAFELPLRHILYSTWAGDVQNLTPEERVRLEGPRLQQAPPPDLT